MRTKKAGHTDLGDNDSEDSDGAESVTGNLPIDSSSDDDDDVLINRLPGAAGEGSGLAATLAMGGMYHRAQAAGGTQPSMLQLCAVLGQPSGPQQATVDGGAMAGVHGATSAANAHGSGQVTAGAAGARRAQGPSVLPEDPNVRRIKAQIRAVWLLQRDLPVPPVLLAETKGTQAKALAITPTEKAAIRPWSTYDNLVSTLCIAQQDADGSALAESSATSVRTRSVGEGFVRGSNGLQEARVGLVEHLAQQRNLHMRTHMKRRQNFLKHVPTANLPPHVADRLDLERKQLQLYDLQLEVRQGLLASHVDVGVAPPHQMSLLKSSETRLDTPVVRQESKEEWEERTREAEMQSRLNRRKAFLEDMRRTQVSFKREHDSIRRWREQICKAVKAWHRNAEKSKEKERADRLAALKSNDFESYRQFVKAAKNERLMELISKTDNYLSSLAAKMSKASKALSTDSKTTESLLELDHQILPLETESNEEKPKQDAPAPGERTRGGDKGGGEEGEAAESDGKAEDGGQKKDDEPSKDKDSQQSKDHNDVDRIFASVKGAKVVIKQPKIMGDGDDGLSKEPGKPALLLKPYQLQGLQWLATLYNNNLSGILADEMGLGKTIQVIGLLTYLIEEKGDQGPFLIIAPLSTITNWALEFERWAPTLDVVVYKGTQQVRKDLFRSRIQKKPLNVLIIQYEMVMSAPDLRMLKQIKWSYMVVDEGHRLKNKDSKLFVVLTREYESRRKLILTGTPLQNNISELWNLLNFLLPTVFDTDADFKTWFSKPFALGEADEEEADASQEEQMVLINRLHQVLRPFMLRRVKTDKDLELSMPENREVVIKCALSALQKIQYRQLSYATLRTRDEKGNLKTTSYNNTIMRLRQVCNHPYLMEDPEWDLGPAMRVRACGKLDVLDRILPKLKAAGHRVLIYSQMVTLLEILAEYIEEQGYKYNKLIGATSSEIRASMIEEFNKPGSDIFLFILSTRAGGQGVNLQTADTVIIFDSDWNPMMDEQAKARINRIGQTKQTLVIRLMTPGTVEEKMLSRANARLRMGDLVIEAGAFKVGASSKDAQALLREKLDQDGILTDVAQIDNEVATDDEMNELIMRTEEELAMWQAMDQQRNDAQANSKSNKLPRLMQEDEVPDSLLGERISKGDRVILLDESYATVGNKVKNKGHEWEVELDDGSRQVVHRTELMLAPAEETEESYEAARLGRRKQTNRSHSVSHHGLTDAEFTRCLEMGMDIDEFVRSKKSRAERTSGRKKAEDEAEGAGSSRKRRSRSSSRRIGDDDADEDDDEDEQDGDNDGTEGSSRSRSKRQR